MANIDMMNAKMLESQIAALCEFMLTADARKVDCATIRISCGSMEDATQFMLHVTRDTATEWVSGHDGEVSVNLCIETFLAAVRLTSDKNNPIIKTEIFGREYYGYARDVTTVTVRDAAQYIAYCAGTYMRITTHISVYDISDAD